MSRRDVALVLLPVLWAAACADAAKEPALAALRDADAAVLGVDPKVERLAPEEVRVARVARDVALAAAARKDWKGAREVALTVPEKVRSAAEVARGRSAALAAAWAKARVDVPNLLYALEDRLDDLDAQATLPPGLDRPIVAAARVELDATRTAWEGLAAPGGAAEPADGVERARTLQERLAAALHRVGGP